MMLTNNLDEINNKKSHDFVTNRGKNTTHIRINYKNKAIEKYTVTSTKNSVEVSNEHTVFNMVPVEIFESYNILDPNAKPKLSLSFYRKGSPQIQTITSDNITNIISSLENRSGIVASKNEARDTLNLVISEYENLGLLKTEEQIPVGGLFINPKTGKLVRSDDNGELKIEKPSKESIKKAIKVWGDLHKIYPGDAKKLSHIIRYGLLVPFTYIFKTEHSFLKYLFLYGSAKTSKTTLAEISLSPYTKIDDTISIGGGGFDTPYRIGHALERHGYGVIVNEPGAMLQDGDCIEIIKRATESGVSREKWDQHEHIKVPAYSNIIFTSNSHLPTEDSLIRRGDIIEFTSDERLDENDVKKFQNKFNYTNRQKNRFNDLTPIGDYIIWYTSQDLTLLSKSKKDIVNEWLDNLLEYADEDKDKWEWIYQDAELMDIEEADDEIRSIFINILNSDYRNTHLNKMYGIFKSLDDEKKHFKDNWKRILGKRLVTYAELHQVKGEDYIFINAQIKNRANEKAGKSISCKSFSSILGYEYKNHTYEGKSKKGFRIHIDDFVELFY